MQIETSETKKEIELQDGGFSFKWIKGQKKMHREDKHPPLQRGK